MSVAPESIQVGQCYLMRTGHVRRAIALLGVARFAVSFQGFYFFHSREGSQSGLTRAVMAQPKPVELCGC